MPGQDGTGPQGQGARTGRGQGPCSGGQMPARPGPKAPPPAGAGRGQGGPGRGQGRRSGSRGGGRGGSR
ncbi:MAG TPA: DUF5320 domain-containing protein [Kiritimatiellia bacterium]|nr:DUF5320 domain-containing protein [Kiritimatiellia bacterium]